MQHTHKSAEGPRIMFVSVTAIAFQTCGKVVPSASGQLLCLIYCPSVWLIRAAGKSQKEFPPYLHWVTPSNPLPPLHPYSSLELIRTSSHFYSLLPQCPLALSDRLQVYASVSDDSLAGVLVTHSQMPGWLWVCLSSQHLCHRQSHPVVLWAVVTGEPPVASSLVMWLLVLAVLLSDSLTLSLSCSSLLSPCYLPPPSCWFWCWILTFTGDNLLYK